MEEQKQDQGEIIEIFQDIKIESESMMNELKAIDTELSRIRDMLQSETADREIITKKIEDIRLRIGVLEKDDQREIEEEKIADNLLKKLKKWVDLVI